MIVIIKSKSIRAFTIALYEKIQLGWEIIGKTKKNIFGVYKAKLKRNET